jgi:hypothetical protein
LYSHPRKLVKIFPFEKRAQLTSDFHYPEHQSKMSNKSGEYKSQTQYAFSVAEEKPKVIEPDPEAIIEDPPKKSDSDLKPKVFGNYRVHFGHIIY